MIDLEAEFLDFDNFDRAWQKVADNNGCAGIDGETIEVFKRRAIENLQGLRDTVANGTYQPHPYLQVLIPKDKTSHRALSIPTVRDRIIQQALLNVLTPRIDRQLSDVSFAYRPQVSYISAVEAVAQCRDAGYQWVLDADIVKYFDNIDRQILFQKVGKYIDNRSILCLLKKWISGGIVTKADTIFTELGIPQGAVISPLLANIYLDDFDRQIQQIGDVRLVRYADDFVVMARSQAEIESAYHQVVRLLGELKLILHDRKTQITTFDRGLRFLGHGFLGAAIFSIDDVKPKRNQGNSKKKVPIDLSPCSLSEVEMSEVDEPLVSASLNQQEDDDSEELAEPVPTQRQVWNPHMATLYLLEQGTSLYRDYQRLIVHIPKQERLEIPIREIDKILIFGNIQLSTPVINSCLDEKIGIFFLSRSGQYQGHLWSAEQTHLHNELVQFDRHKEPEFQLNMCRAIVTGKLLNSKRLLQRLNRKRKSPEVEKAIAGINADLKAASQVNEIDRVRGYEGIGAVRYFSGLSQLITNPDFSFNGRNRQPPTDPVNSLLSFGYTLLFNNVLSLILAEGLSPYLGNLHYGEDKKPYLAFDLMEEFRSPIVDGLILKLINKPVFKLTDFDTVAATGGVYLQGAARRGFLKYFEARMNEDTAHPDLQNSVSYRYAIQLQIRRYKRSLLGNTPYEPFARVV
ncbi:CRISPR-associated endonuclease Cas1 [Chamaesiphon polymorphus]|uniref:CRISPR-associated endonuclease Cas1 n=1 Tax=Chamaesiphon polymorphus CCALA 037 TaxID=2107692 RepID=A0A2T1GLS3_9CYAN|nr:CRISPR-associated endonuclease Cas1 [Chamaesiphon polymorphus]PSB58763.1 CRISPR-associated endonuclease Cas1 [Chamaesiphon polymorphus CCALA 037]